MMNNEFNEKDKENEYLPEENREEASGQNDQPKANEFIASSNKDLAQEPNEQPRRQIPRQEPMDYGYQNQQQPNPNPVNRQQPYYQQPQTQYGQYQQQQYGQYQQQYSSDPMYRSYQNVAEEQPQKVKKPKKAASRGFVVGMVILGIVLSGATGFGGAYLATRGGSSMVQGSGLSSGGGAPVIYKADNTNLEAGSTIGGGAVEAVADVAADSVVEITTETVMTNSFFGQYVTDGAGSGVIVTEDGYIITCAHVVSGATVVTVTLTNGQQYPATIVGEDSMTDIAVLKVDGAELPYAVCGDSDQLKVGQEAVAIGNPLGELGGTVTNGIISALDREVEIDGQAYNLLQTNAAINPGNSGGGLFNLKGELIGVVNAKSSGTGIEGLGFAIPINDALDIANELMEHGYIKGRPQLGVYIMEYDESTNLFDLYEQGMSAVVNYLSDYGVYFLEYSEHQEDTGLMFGDRIVAINDVTVSTKSDITAVLSEYAVGDTVTLTVSRISTEGSGFASRHKRVQVEIELKLIENIPE